MCESVPSPGAQPAAPWPSLVPLQLPMGPELHTSLREEVWILTTSSGSRGCSAIAQDSGRVALAAGYLEQVPRGVRDRKRKETARQVQSPGRMLEHEPAQGGVQRPLSEELGGVGLGGVTQSSSCPRPQGLSP